jgi:hypothetical protein
VTVNKKKIKTLVCILGQTRAQDITWNNFNSYLLKSLNADLALCVAEKKTLNNQMYKNAKYIWKYKDLKDYSKHFEDAQKKLIKSKKLIEKPNWKKMLKIKDFWLGRIKGSSSIRSGTGALLIFNRWFLLQKILKLGLNKKYDRFIITRSDFIWTIHHPSMKNLNSNYIWIPNGEKYGGYTDRHAVLSNKNFYDYLNLLEPILLEPEKLFRLMSSKKNWNLERYIKFYLDKKGYSKKVKFFPYIMFSVRNKLIKTGFRPGSFSYKHKFFIKYFKEYLSSMIMYFVIGNKNKNYNKFKILYIIYRLFKSLFKIRFLFYIFFLNKKILIKFDQKFIRDNLKKKFLF